MRIERRHSLRSLSAAFVFLIAFPLMPSPAAARRSKALEPHDRRV